MARRLASLSASAASAASAASGAGYKWVFMVLLVILLIVFLYAYMRSREGFEGGSGNLMYFFMPGCGHCQQFNPEWEKLKSMVDQKRVPLRLTKVDGTEDANKDLVEQYKVNGFPTIILEIGSDSNTYSGERTADAIMKWAMNLMK